ncbi:hypothetical protein K458DRAFT_359313 [Lentithecium fluviatile CBS 122367]|uniref:RING-type domain-containing protein n=1 Tax=Lentithecium fluviatile CBS 122367 TaxID=1168545 RepID=A0A6G1JDN5_9PLEO|nr:hypothetical protein K458DRAFT_359313 [Lentithecium fluviatile CBS 122367]
MRRNQPLNPTTIVLKAWPTTPRFAKCYVCQDEVSIHEGVAPCTAHYICNACVVSAFDLTVRDTGLNPFPAQCCRPLPRRLVEHLLTLDVVARHKRKCEEYYVSCVLRVYCVECGTFLPKTNFCNDDARYTSAKCACGAQTFVGYKGKWEKDHRCDHADKLGVKPEWTPAYSSYCRIKRCPGCRMWIERKEACNHMTCTHCQHQFCFVCLLPFPVSHARKRCPSYGDLAAWYDKEGYEKTEKGCIETRA